MISFLRKNYKKIFIIFSSFIIFYSLSFVRLHEVKGFAISSPDSYLTDIRYINGNKHLGIKIDPSINATYIIDLPTTSSSVFAVDSLSYTITALDVQFSLSQSFVGSTDLDITSFSYPNVLGTLAIYIDSLLYRPTGDDPLGIILHSVLPTFSDTIDYWVYTNYYKYNSYSSSISLEAFQYTGSYFGNDFYLDPFSEFVSSTGLNYDCYFLKDIVIFLTPDFADTTTYEIYSKTSSDPNYFSYQNFIEFNDFSLGVSQEELDDAYDNGFIAGVDSVDTQEFYNEGYTNASQDFLKFENLIFGVMNGFTNTISELFDFQIFGISVFGLVGGLVAIAFAVGIIILIIKVIKIFT